MKDNLNKSWLKTTSIEDGFNGRKYQHQWEANSRLKTTSAETNFNGRQTQFKTTSIEDNLNGRQH